MEWEKIDIENLPDKKVLAANFAPGTYGYKEKIIGYIGLLEGNDRSHCENDHEILENCTHFIPINDFDIDE